MLSSRLRRLTRQMREVYVLHWKSVGTQKFRGANPIVETRLPLRRRIPIVDVANTVDKWKNLTIVGAHQLRFCTRRRQYQACFSIPFTRIGGGGRLQGIRRDFSATTM